MIDSSAGLLFDFSKAFDQATMTDNIESIPVKKNE